ncbi:STAS domain-containing protein [Curvibacter sp. RS43]|jgi:anti-anti-sigma regulatory factor|uniref:STAS domain-containing protein n=1 Tax=Curvibacter microcysteis TaxID=3026419 RepID=A0ABT5MF64_9BURK|nr:MULTISPECIES: STAS domain-containing protein [unclassified Curvibacter]MDD0809901.1 STAS domain-containing protein [Curvibacter sp. RS43]MDD0815076.1 STAS domain-containing protein [Curvibacter sp. HBC28]
MSEPFTLPDELTIYTVESTRQALLLWLQDPHQSNVMSRAVHGGAVNDVDGAGLQLLGALANSLSAQGQAMDLIEPSPLLRDALQALGCAHWFALNPEDSTP